jgi:uncharacterized protein (TIGR03437 family)
VTAPAQTEGPYFVEENLNRSDIRVDPTDGTISPGVVLTLSVTVHQVNNTSCGLLPGAHVEIWHCDAGGIYSDVAANNSRGKKFLRGYQTTDSNGMVNFTTVYPGWYSGRTVHIHFKVRTYSGTTKYDEFTSQLFFDDIITDEVFTQAPYSSRRTRDTRNANDMVLAPTANKDRLMLAVTKTGETYAASVDIGVNMKTAAAAAPTVTANGVVNAASYQAGVAPGAWTTIFGTDFSTVPQALTTADIVNGSLPTTLGGVSVLINSKPAFVSFVSPTQINVQAPADTNQGAVQVVVTNSTGTSNSVTANLQTVLPAFFASQNYVAAVRADGTIISGTGANGTTAAAKPGDVLSLYGTGFGPTNPVVAPGILVQSAAPLANPLAVTIGGLSAPVSFAGLSATGLYQFNVTVPALAAGDHAVVATTAGLSTQSGVLLKVQNS